MIKILKHDSLLRPFYIAVSNEPLFHVIYDEQSIGSANSIAGAIESIESKDFFGISDCMMDWERLIPIAIEPNLNG